MRTIHIYLLYFKSFNKITYENNERDGGKKWKVKTHGEFSVSAPEDDSKSCLMCIILYTCHYILTLLALNNNCFMPK